MASVANQEDIPPSLDPLRDSPHLRPYGHNRASLGSIPPVFHPTDETPSKSYIETPINPSHLSTRLTPAFDALGISFQTSGSHHHHSKSNIRFPENINPQHRSIIEGMLKTNWSPGDLEGRENSIIMDHNGIPEDSPPPLASSTPVPISILPPDETEWKTATIKTGGPNTAKKVYEQGGIWQTEGVIRSGELFYDKKTKLFRNYKQDWEQTSAKDEDDNRSVIFEEIQFVPEIADSTQDVEMEDVEVPVSVPTTPTAGLRRAVTRSQNTVRKAQPQEDTKAFPQTEPRRPVKSILKTPIVPLEASGLYKTGKSTGNTHRSWGWYDSTSFSPLDGREVVETPAKKATKGKGKGKGRNVQVDEVVDERILSSEESEGERPKGKNYNEDKDDESEFEDSGDEGDRTPSKKPKTTKGKSAGRKPKKEQESSCEEEGDKEEKEKPAPKKQGKPQAAPKNKRRKQKNEDEGAFKPDNSSSDVEEEYETSKPRRGRKPTKVEQVVDNDEENNEGAEEAGGEEVTSNTGADQGSENEDAGEEEIESEGGEEGENKTGAGSGSDNDDNNGSKNNNQSGSEEGEEDEDEYIPQKSGTAVRSTGTKKGADPPQPLVSKSSSSKSRDRSLMKRMSVENQRAKADGQPGLRKAQAGKAFEIQEQFKRDGSLREVQLSGFVPSETGWAPGQKEKAPPAPPAFKFPKTVEEGTSMEKPSQVEGLDGIKKIHNETEQRTETVFPITQKELETAITTIEQSDELLKKALENGRKYRHRGRKAMKKIATLEDRIRELEEELKKAGNDCAELELQVAAKNAIGHDNLSYLYADPDPKIDDLLYGEGGQGRRIFPDKYPTIDDIKKIGGAQLYFQKCNRLPFSSKIRNNPFHHEDMYERRRIISDLTFPGNAMLIDHGTDYFFKCCFCSKVSPINISFFQDELIWSVCKCFACDAHMCCGYCSRWTAPTIPSRLPETRTAIELLNGRKGKENYEASLYLRGIWWDYIRQKEDSEAHEGFRGLMAENCRFEFGYPDSETSFERAAEGNTKQAGLRSIGRIKRKSEDGEEANASKRIKIEEILEKRRLARRPPLPEADEDDEEDDDEEEYEDDEIEVVVGGDGSRPAGRWPVESAVE